MSVPHFRVDPRSATPLYDQLTRQVKAAVAAGTLEEGMAMPSVRQLAVELRINPNTVARAYRELEREGIVESRRGQGTFVGEGERSLTSAGRRRALAPVVEQLVAEARLLRVPGNELVTLVEKAYAKFEKGAKK